jgi:hypothetical protein
MEIKAKVLLKFWFCDQDSIEGTVWSYLEQIVVLEREEFFS